MIHATKNKTRRWYSQAQNIFKNIQDLRKFKGIQEEPSKNIGYHLKLRSFPFAFPLFFKYKASDTININLFICDLPHSSKSGVQRKKNWSYFMILVSL